MGFDVMKREILLMRHAKSDWDAAYGDDHERPLNRRGQRAASKVGSWLASIGATPDRLLSSTAVRARTTAELTREAGKWRCEIELHEGLYGARAQAVVDLIRAQPEEAERVMLVGHEPTWSECVGRLIGEGHVRMPTGAVAAIRMPVSEWRDAAFGLGVLRFLVPPKALPGTLG